MATKHFTEKSKASPKSTSKIRKPYLEKLPHEKPHIESDPRPGSFPALYTAVNTAYGLGHIPVTPKPYLKEFHKELLLDKIVVKEHLKEHLKDTIKESTKEIVETKQFELPQDPGGPIEQRTQALEAAVGQMAHFISQALRPDLSQGALRMESDVAPKAKKAVAKKKAAKKSPKASS